MTQFKISCHGCLLANFFTQLKICKGTACRLCFRKSNYILARVKLGWDLNLGLVYKVFCTIMHYTNAPFIRTV